MKKIDLIGQLLCFIVPFLFLFVHGLFSVLMYIYIALGAWQVLSFIVHRYFVEDEYKVALRKKYGNILGIIVVIALASLLLTLCGMPHLLVLSMLAALFVTPFIAIVYLIVTLEELHLATIYIQRNEFVQKR